MPLICLAFVLIKLPVPIFLCWQKYCSVNYLKQINALSVLVVGSFTAQRKQRTKIKSNSFFCPNVLVTSLRCTFWAVVLIKLAVKEGQVNYHLSFRQVAFLFLLVVCPNSALNTDNNPAAYYALYYVFGNLAHTYFVVGCCRLVR